MQRKEVMRIKQEVSFLLVMVVAASAMTLDDDMPEIIQQVTSRDPTPEIIEQVTTHRVKTVPLRKYADPLPQPAVIDAAKLPSLSLTMGMYQTTQKFHQDMNATTIFAYGTSAATATFPGPTIVTSRYTYTNVTWENHLPNSHIFPNDTTITAAQPPNGGVPTVVHLHGGAVAPDSDGYALAWYTNNYANVSADFTRKSYFYPNDQNAGNLVYHDHAVGFTRINLLAGLLGSYIIKDPAFETPLNLPNGQFDLLLVIADRYFNADGSLFLNLAGASTLHPKWIPEFYGDAITVNGKIWPYLNVTRRKYRFRIINASNARYYDLSFNPTSGITTPYNFTVIGSDSNYLNAPVNVTHVVLSIAETFDVVFDFSTVGSAGFPAEVELRNSAPYPYNNPTATSVSGTNLSYVMKFQIANGAVADTSTIPAKLANLQQALPAPTAPNRTLALYEYLDSQGKTKHLLINGKKFNETVTETPKNGSTERWDVINLTGDDHPLHIHLAHFQSIGSSPVLNNLTAFTACMQANNNSAAFCNMQLGPAIPVPNHEKTWKNVVKLPPGHVTSVIVHFKLLHYGGWSLPYPFDPTAKPGYVYHCHILDHEDNEMIRPLVLTP